MTAPEEKNPAGPRAGEKVSHKAKRVQELAQELRVLRATFKEILEPFTLKVDGRLLEMIRVLERNASAGERLRLPTAKGVQAMLGKIRRLKLKPKKARPKDVCAIAETVLELAERMPNQP